MDHDRLRRVQELFRELLDSDPSERGRFLERLRAEEPELALEVESLLRADHRAGDFLERSPPELDRIFSRHQAGLPPGTEIGPYAVQKLLGRGGMGDVYLAERADEEYEKQVAIKLIRPGADSEEILDRFWRERQILANLEHPNIARLFDGGTTANGQPYLVMEHVAGEPIDRYCDHHRLSIDARLRLFRSVCAAVEYAHRNLVVHRDLKPGNILVTASGVPKLLDFGIAKVLVVEGLVPGTTTRTGLLPMSPEYASPEQVRAGPITTSTDVYALGLVLYLLLTGQRPQKLGSLSLPEIERVVCERTPERPSAALSALPTRAGSEGEAMLEGVAAARSTTADKLRRKLAGDLDTVVMKALHKEPERRQRSVEELSEDLRRHLVGLPVRARADTLVYRTAKFVRRHLVGMAAAAVVVGTLVGGMASTAWQARQASTERDRAQTEARKSEQVAGFLTDLFRAADPEETQGDTVLVSTILERGQRRIGETLQDQPEVRATMLTVLGEIYGNMGRYEQAQQLLEEALALRRRLYGSHDERVAESLTHLADLLQRDRRFEDAEPLYREALYMSRWLAKEGAGGPAAELQVAHNLNELGLTLRDLGKPDSAETLVREALEIRRRLLGDDHPEVTEMKADLAFVLRARGDLDTAEALYRDVITRLRTSGETSPDLPVSLNNLAYLLMLKRAYSEAEALYREALSVHRSIYGEGHPQTLRLMTNLAGVLYDQGKYQEIEAVLREVVRLEREYRPGGPRLGSYMATGLGRFLAEQGRYAEAEPIVRDGLEILERELPPDHRWVLNAQVELGACLRELGRFAEAERLLLRAYEGLSAAGPSQKRRARTALEHVIQLYESWDQNDKADAYRAQLAALGDTSGE